MELQNTYPSHQTAESLMSASKEAFLSSATQTFDKNPTRILKHNPFSTRFTAPGAIPYYFPSEYCEKIKRECVDFKHYFFQSMVDADHLKTNICLLYLIDLFKKNRCYGQIVGHHGSGKSTLLAALTQILELHACVIQESLHDKQRCLSDSFWTALTRNHEKKTIAIIDGYEQLSWLQRFKLRSVCRLRNIGLILTTHKKVFRIPILYETKPSQEILEQIVDYLLELPCHFIKEKTLKELMNKHKNNIRSVLFSLYDLYEDQPPISV